MKAEKPAATSPVETNEGPLTVLHSRTLSDYDHVQSDLFAAEARSAGIFLNMVRDTAAVRGNEMELLSVLTKYTFQAFPLATHLVLAVRHPESPDEPLNILCARSRTGQEPEVALSTTLVSRVMGEGVTLLYSRSQSDIKATKSLLLSKISNAICAPLRSVDDTFGIIELDIRRPGTGIFSAKDVDRMAVFAHHVALVLDNHRLGQEQRRAFESTINALVHSLFLKDPDTARHSERVQKVSLLVGQELGLSDTALEALGVAAILHDVGKQGVRDAVLLKPAQLSDGERREMAHHAALTENILDKIVYPAHLKDVPLMAAYHHEKMNGKGHYKMTGEDIPIQSRIISVADAFDALISVRVYKKAMPVEEVFMILERGANRDWDPKVIAAARQALPSILAQVYPRAVEPQAATTGLEEAA